jgi:hypothetical protein
MQRKWRRILAPAGAALLGASALAVASDGDLPLFRDQEAAAVRDIRAADAEPCPPGACTIVFKTAAGGPPSLMLDQP